VTLESLALLILSTTRSTGTRTTNNLPRPSSGGKGGLAKRRSASSRSATTHVVGVPGRDATNAPRTRSASRTVPRGVEVAVAAIQREQSSAAKFRVFGEENSR
jgi:hypothetical protein